MKYTRENIFSNTEASNGYGIFIKCFYYDANDKVVILDASTSKIRKSTCTLFENTKGAYFTHLKRRYYLSEFVRNNI